MAVFCIFLIPHTYYTFLFTVYHYCYGLMESFGQVQDGLNRIDISSYIEQGKCIGITDEKVLIYFSNCYNQSPAGISRIDDILNKHWSTISLDTLHTHALQDIYEKDRKSLV